MIRRECKRLAEVDFPIAEVSKHAAREKSIPARASLNAAPVVGAATAGFVAGGADGVAAAGPLRPQLSGNLQAKGSESPPPDEWATIRVDDRRQAG